MENSMYLLTGAAGNLGCSVARQLVSEGKKVRALVLRDDPAIERLPRNVEIITGDVTDMASLRHFFSAEGNTNQSVIHCASMMTGKGDFHQQVYDVNVSGTKNIVQKCIENCVRKLIYISSTGAITEQPHGKPISEPRECTADSVVGFYEQTKAVATQIVLDAVKEYGLDASIVYPTRIAGPDDYSYGPVSTLIMEYLKGNMSVGINGSFNAVDVRDLAKGVVACCAKGRKGEGYIMGNACVSMKEMIHHISVASGSKEVMAILPLWLARILAKMTEIADRITGKSSLLTTHAIYDLSRNNVFSSDKAIAELGYNARPFRETIADAVEWLKAETGKK